MSSKIKQKKVCLRWLNGKNCPFTAERCIFMHTKDYEALCRDWVEGKCIGGKGNSCSSRHYYLESDQNMNHQIMKPNTPTTTTLPMDTFSSPLVVRNIKETKQLRKIHVDLDTGLEKSFTEEIVEEIVDLTGQATPARPPAKMKKANLENIDPKKVQEKSEKPEKPAKSVSPAKKLTNEKALIKENECKYCNKEFKGTIGVRSHLSRNKVCSQKFKVEQNLPQPKTQGKKKNNQTNLRRSERFSSSQGSVDMSVMNLSTTRPSLLSRQTIQLLTSTPAISRVPQGGTSFNSPTSSSIDSLLGGDSPHTLSKGQSQSIIEINDSVNSSKPGENTITID